MIKCDMCNKDLSKEKILFYDIIKIKGVYYAEHCLIPWDRNDDAPEDKEYIMDVDEFFDYAAKKYSCDVDDIESLFMDNLDVPREVIMNLPYGEEWTGGHCPDCDSIL